MEPREDNRVWLDGEERPVGSFGREPLGRPEPERVAVVGDARRLFEAAVRFFRQRLDGVAVAAEAWTPELAALLADRGYAVLGAGGETPGAGRRPGGAAETAGGGAERSAPGGVGVLTSGSTGAPKLVPHTWESLFTAARVDAAPRRWLVTYQGGTYAWYQLVTLGLFLPGQDLVVTAAADPEAVLEAGIAAGADAVSATPTFWQYLLVKAGPERLARLPLRQATLGGEPVRQPVLDRLRAVYPQARISHVYASSEAGAAVVVHDGREGFPREWLWQDRPEAGGEAAPCRPLLRVEQGELWVRSPHASTAVRGWLATGDAVVERDGRVVVVGRKGEDRLIVGGRKVGRERVVSALSAHPAVRWCAVRTRDTPVGAAVVAEVVLAPGALAGPAADAERELTRFARGRGLPEWAVPRIWRFLEEVPIAVNRKSA